MVQAARGAVYCTVAASKVLLTDQPTQHRQNRRHKGKVPNSENDTNCVGLKSKQKIIFLAALPALIFFKICYDFILSRLDSNSFIFNMVDNKYSELKIN